MYIFDTFFTVPRWCQQGHSTAEWVECNSDDAPNSRLPKMPYLASTVIDASCLLVLLFFTYFRRTFRKISRTARVREIIQTAITVAAIVDIIIGLVVGYHTVADFAKPFLFVVFVRSVREAWKRVLLVMWDSKDILLMLAAYIVFFGWAGYRIFKGSLEGEAYFPTLSDGLFNMLVLMTTTNHPDVMLPAYQRNRAAVVYFVIYLVLGLYFFMNLLLAIFYNNYKQRVVNTMSKFVDSRQEFLRGVFCQIDVQKKGYLTETQCRQMVERLIAMDKNLDLSSINVKRFVRLLDADGSSRIHLDEFLRFYDILDELLFEHRQNQLQTQGAASSRGASGEPDEPKCRDTTRRFFKHPLYDSVVNLLCVLNIFSFMARDLLELYGETRLSVQWWLTVQFVVNFLFGAETSLMLYSCGFKWVRAQRPLNLSVEVLIQILNFVSISV